MKSLKLIWFWSSIPNLTLISSEVKPPIFIIVVNGDITLASIGALRVTPGNGCPEDASIVVESVLTAKEYVSLELVDAEFPAL